MRVILTSAAVAVLSIVISASPANAQAAHHKAVIVSPEEFAAAQEQAPASIRTESPRARKSCDDFVPRGGGWYSERCNSAELTAYLSAKGIPMAPPTVASTSPYSSVSPSEQARRDSLNFDEDLRQRRVVFDASVNDTQAERADQRQNRCEGRAFGREILGGAVNALTGGLESRLSRGGGYYYRGGYYSQRGSSCGSNRY